MLPLNRIVLDSELSSDLFQETEDVPVTSVAIDPSKREWHQYFLERCLLSHSTDLSETWEPISKKESSYPLHFLSQIAVKEHDTDILIRKFKHDHSVFIYKRGEAIPRIIDDPFMQSYLDGPPDDAWIVPVWILRSPTTFDWLFHLELGEFEKDMRNILNQFNWAEPFHRPNSIVKMAAEIADNLAEPEQEAVDAWAEHLAEDVSRTID